MHKKDIYHFNFQNQRSGIFRFEICQLVFFQDLCFCFTTKEVFEPLHHAEQVKVRDR